MSEALPTTPDRDEAMLARLAEFDLSAAERVHGRLMAAEAASEIAELGRTYQRIARSLRQTLALKARLKRERAQTEIEPQAAGGKPGGVAVARRIRELSAAVTRVIWNETEDETEAEFHEENLADLIADECLRDAFCAETLDDHVARVCLSFGFSAEAAETWRDLPDPAHEAGDPGDEADRRGSG